MSDAHGLLNPDAETGRAHDDRSAGSVSVASQWQAAVERVRDTNAWIIKAFSALGVLLVGSGPLLIRLGDLPSWPRSAVAAVAAAVGLVGVGVVIRQASRVMLPKTADLLELASADSGDLARLRRHIEETAGGPELYLGGEAQTIAGLLDHISAWRESTKQLESLHAQVLALERTDAPDPDYPEDLATPIARAQVIAALGAGRAWLHWAQRRTEELVEQAVYFEVRGTFDRALPKMFAGAAAAAVGTAIYLGALGIDLAQGVDVDTPAGVQGGAPSGLLVWDTGTPSTAQNASRPVANLRRDLGLVHPGCDRIPVTFTGAGSVTDPWLVTTLEGGTCNASPRSFAVDERFASIRSLQPVGYRLEQKNTEDGPLLALTFLAGVVGAGVAVGGCVVIGRFRRSRASKMG